MDGHSGPSPWGRVPGIRLVLPRFLGRRILHGRAPPTVHMWSPKEDIIEFLTLPLPLMQANSSGGSEGLVGK